MLNKKIYGIVEASILSDRNLNEDDITEIKMAENIKTLREAGIDEQVSLF